MQGEQQSLFASGNASFMQPFRSAFGGGSVAESGSTAGSEVSGSMVGSFMGSITDEISGTRPSSHPPTRPESVQDGILSLNYCFAITYISYL